MKAINSKHKKMIQAYVKKKKLGMKWRGVSPTFALAIGEWNDGSLDEKANDNILNVTRHGCKFYTC